MRRLGTLRWEPSLCSPNRQSSLPKLMNLLHVSGCFIQTHKVSEFYIQIDAERSRDHRRIRSPRTRSQELQFVGEILTFTDCGIGRELMSKRQKGIRWYLGPNTFSVLRRKGESC